MRPAATAFVLLALVACLATAFLRSLPPGQNDIAEDVPIQSSHHFVGNEPLGGLRPLADPDLLIKRMHHSAGRSFCALVEVHDDQAVLGRREAPLVCDLLADGESVRVVHITRVNPSRVASPIDVFLVPLESAARCSVAEDLELARGDVAVRLPRSVIAALRTAVLRFETIEVKSGLWD